MSTDGKKPPALATPNPARAGAVGFTLVEIMIVVAIIGLLAAIALPSFMRARAASQANACINNLKQLQSAVDQMAIERGMSYGQTFNFPADITPYIRLTRTGGIPACPAGGNYGNGAIGTTVASCTLGSSVTPPHILP